MMIELLILTRQSFQLLLVALYCRSILVVSPFLLSTFIRSILLSEIQCKSLGMKVEVFNPIGTNIEHTGEPGELVCTRPHVSLPLGFWGDPSRQKLRDAYYNMYPGDEVPSSSRRRQEKVAKFVLLQVSGDKEISSS